jgi:hypothetical protein
MAQALKISVVTLQRAYIYTDMAIEYYFSEGQLVNMETHFLIAVSSLRLALKVCYLPPH